MICNDMLDNLIRIKHHRKTKGSQCKNQSKLVTVVTVFSTLQPKPKNDIYNALIGFIHL
jgi:hypothetical protein